MLEFHDARRRLFALARVLSSERVDVRRATGRVVAQDIRSPVAVPGFDNSAMDGYAVCSTALNPTLSEVQLPVVGESRAGAPGRVLAPHSAMRIFTGALLPAGADAVVLQEDVTREADQVRFAPSAVSAHQHVRRQGEDVRPGDAVVAKGTRLSAFHLSLLASVEQTVLPVVRRPRVTILCTGDELRQAGAAGSDGSLPESNGVALASLCEMAGAVVSLGPLGTDQLPAFRALLTDALNSSDLVVTVGGVSVGDYDVVREAMTQAGVVAEFWKVRMRPGKPLAIGSHGHTLVLGLPGNPVSAQVTACLFMVPLLRLMQGDGQAVAPFVQRRLSKPLEQPPGRRGFYRATLAGDEVTPHARQGSGSVISMAQANALVSLDEHSTIASAGELIETLSLRDI